jgi:hypothetical protein
MRAADDMAKSTSTTSQQRMNHFSSLNESQSVHACHDWHARHLGRVISLVRPLVAARRDRPYLSLVALPLAILATTLEGSVSPALLWLLVPLVTFTWYWGSTEWSWTWVLGVMEAAYGVQWGVIGTYCLAAFPHDRIVVGILWAAYAGGVAGVAAASRSQYEHRYGW